MVMGIKQFVQKLISNNAVVHPQGNMWGWDTIPRTKINYSREVGTGLGSNVVMSPIGWLMTNFVESDIILEQEDFKGGNERVLKHSFLRLVRKPNSFYSMDALLMASILSYNLSGNAYWLKIRNAQGKVIQLWYLPHWMVRPVGDPVDSTVFIKKYEYTPGGTKVDIPVEDMLHFRYGLDPTNPRRGFNRMASVIREIFTDDEASNFSASLLKNNGVPGVVISPDGEESLSLEEATERKAQFKGRFTGDNVGNPLVMTGKTKVTTFGFDPKKLDLSSLRNVSEERVCAILQMPAAVVGFGAGLQATKVGATMQAMVKLAYTGNIIPTQRVFKQTLEDQLLLEFDNNESLRVNFDNSKVSALQEDKDKKVARIGKGVVEGWAMVSDARMAEGLTVEEEHKVFLRSFNTVEE